MARRLHRIAGARHATRAQAVVNGCAIVPTPSQRWNTALLLHERWKLTVQPRPLYILPMPLTGYSGQADPTFRAITPAESFFWKFRNTSVAHQRLLPRRGLLPLINCTQSEFEHQMSVT